MSCFQSLEFSVFVTGYRPYDPFPVEVDFDEMRWVIKKLEFCEDPDMLYW
ncbi:hypothetical protein Hanom_Chr16g01491831 [Helianthus anomalus]